MLLTHLARRNADEAENLPPTFLTVDFPIALAAIGSRKTREEIL